MTSNTGNKPAWVQLYEARRLEMEIEPRSPGRPPAPIPRRKVGFTLSQGEIRELEAWQERFSRLAEHSEKSSERAERSSERSSRSAERAAEQIDVATLAELVERMIGE